MTTDQLPSRGAVLITGASSGIGAVYADRFARRGRDLVLVARDAARLTSLANSLRAETGVRIDVFPADLTRTEDLAQLERRLRDDAHIETLINNAGAAAHGSHATADADALDQLIRLNVTAVSRLGAAVIPRFLAAGHGEIINVASAVAVIPEIPFGAYSATKAYVLSLSQSMQTELGPRGIYVQAVMPSATRTEIWSRSGRDANTIPGMMPVEELVDAALVGYDRKELITIPSLPDEAQWKRFEDARLAMAPNFRNEHPAARYRA